MPNHAYFSAKLRDLLLLIITLCLLAGVLEIGARIFSDVPPNLRERDELIGYRYARSTGADVFERESGRTIYMRFNQVGFRGPDYDLEKPANVTRVAFLGDSMVAGLQVDEEDSMVHLLEKMLNSSETGRQWEVMNFGISGSSPGQAIALWREEVIRFDPDIVLLGYFVGNDLANNCTCIGSARDRIYFDIDEDGVYRQQPQSQGGVSVSQFLNRHSSFYRWQKIAFKSLKSTLRGDIRDGKVVQRFKDGDLIYSRREDPPTAYAWRLTDEAINTLHREVTAQGGQFAVAMIPMGYQIYDDAFARLGALRPDLQEYMDQEYPDERIGAMCQEEGILFFSMLDEFRAAAPGRSAAIEEEHLFFTEGLGHFNEEGNLTAAQATYKFLSQEKFAPQ